MRIFNLDGAGAVVLSLMVALICVIGSVGGTYLFLKSDLEAKQVEYENLQSTYEEDITEYQNKYENLMDDVGENEVNRTKYEKMMFQGIRENVNGDYSYGYAVCDFENAGLNYDGGYLDVAITYFDSADVFFAASNDFYKAENRTLAGQSNLHQMTI